MSKRYDRDYGCDRIVAVDVLFSFLRMIGGSKLNGWPFRRLVLRRSHASNMPGDTGFEGNLRSRTFSNVALDNAKLFESDGRRGSRVFDISHSRMRKAVHGHDSFNHVVVFVGTVLRVGPHKSPL